MENNTRKQVGSSSSSSFPSELFGTKEPSSNDVFASIFPPRKGMESNSFCSPEGIASWQKPQTSGYQTWNSKQDSTMEMRDHHHHHHDSRVEPSYLSSSLFYGGQEMYNSHPPAAPPHSTGSYSSFKKDAAGGEDGDPTGALRGNWWQGSLYY